MIESNNRRAHRRYPILLQLQYKLMAPTGVQHVGVGQTINVSSHGVLCDVNKELPKNSRIELSIQWPYLLHGTCPLNLVVQGRIVRTGSHSVAVQAEAIEFRTAGRVPVGRRAV